MVAITATNSATVSLQVTLNKARLEQAQREADQAENNAKQLRSQADQAERDAQQGYDNVRKVSAANRQSDATYSSPAHSSGAETPLKVQDFIENLYKATSQKRADQGNALKTDANSAPVINAQGHSTGRILNLKT
jgi:hypothetical protein